MNRLLLHPSTEDGIKRIIASSPHGIGIQGPAESGKKHLAKYLIKEMLGVNDAGKHPYVMTLDCNAKPGIEGVRNAIKFLSLKIPGDKKYRRALLFYSFEKLGIEAQNALLKSLEEPPDDTLIIITADSRTSLLPTTVSRLSWLNVLPVSLDQSLKYFSKFDESEIKKAYLLSNGKPSMIIKLLNDYDIHQMVKTIEITKKILKMDRHERIAEVDKLLKDDEFDLYLYLQSLSKVLGTAMKSKILKSNVVDRKLLNNLSKIISAENAQKYNANQKLLLTDVFYNL